MFSKEGDSSSTNRDCFSWPVYIPDSKAHLSIAREIRVLYGQLQPFIPTGEKIRGFSLISDAKNVSLAMTHDKAAQHSKINKSSAVHMFYYCTVYCKLDFS